MFAIPSRGSWYQTDVRCAVRAMQQKRSHGARLTSVAGRTGGEQGHAQGAAAGAHRLHMRSPRRPCRPSPCPLRLCLLRARRLSRLPCLFLCLLPRRHTPAYISAVESTSLIFLAAPCTLRSMIAILVTSLSNVIRGLEFIAASSISHRVSCHRRRFSPACSRTSLGRSSGRSGDATTLDRGRKGGCEVALRLDSSLTM